MNRKTLREVVEVSIAARAEMRRAGNWQDADMIRAVLLEHQILLEDQRDGSTTWRDNAPP